MSREIELQIDDWNFRLRTRKRESKWGVTVLAVHRESGLRRSEVILPDYDTERIALTAAMEQCRVFAETPDDDSAANNRVC